MPVTSAPPAPPVAPVRRRRRWLTGLAAAGAVVLAAVAGIAVTTTGRGSHPPEPATPPRSPAPVVAADPFLGGPVCPTANRTVLTPASRKPTWPALIPGWVWYQDPTGFRIAVPGNWQAYSGGSGMCFQDVDGGRWPGVAAWTAAGHGSAHLTRQQRQ